MVKVKRLPDEFHPPYYDLDLYYLSLASTGTAKAYEEGSWTPVIAFGGSTTGVTYSTQAGRYIKIGKLVYIWFGIVLTSNGTGTGSAMISGLPATSDATAGSGAITASTWAGMSGISGYIFGNVAVNATTLNLRHSGATATALLTDTNITDTATLVMSGCYQAAS